MIIRHVSIENFRGIKSLDWHVDGRLICLVGPGDSTKTTILDAIELTLAPRWYVPFADADFHRTNTLSPIHICVTIGELTDELLTEDKCGLYLRGYRPDMPIHDDPEDGWDPVVTVRLVVKEDLEPAWELIKDGIPDPKPLSWRDRERLSLARIGEENDRQLTWSRGSSLAKITDKNANPGPTLALANRAANQAIAGQSLTELAKAAEKARDAAKLFGVQLPPLRPGLDTQSLSFGSGALSLHDDARIPIRAIGLGSRRLIGLSIQQIGLGPEAILLIDEIEHGLEPHRQRRLLKKLVTDHAPIKVEGNNDVPAQGQVVMTTHSPTPIVALPVTALRFVRSTDGVTTVQRVGVAAVDSVQSIIRRISHSVLANKIIICEGTTEEALCRVLDQHWSMAHDGESFAYHSVVAVSGGGRDSGPKAAVELRRLGYDVCFFGETDEPLSLSESELEQNGVLPVLWPDKMATEQRIAADLPLPGLQRLIDVAIEIHGDQSILNSVGQKLGKPLVSVGPKISDWSDSSIKEANIRAAIGLAAKKTLNGWFKDVNAGELLGNVVTSALGQISDSPLAKTIAIIEKWVYGK